MTAGKAKGSAENSYGDLAFHATGLRTKSSGGFELYDVPNYGYFSGKVVCYIQNDTSEGAFIARITKADASNLVGDYVIVWLAPNQFSFDITETYTALRS